MFFFCFSNYSVLVVLRYICRYRYAPNAVGVDRTCIFRTRRINILTRAALFILLRPHVDLSHNTSLMAAVAVCVTHFYYFFLFLINDVSGKIFKRNGYLLPVVFFLLLMDARRAAYVPYTPRMVYIYMYNTQKALTGYKYLYIYIIKFYKFIKT